MRIKHFLVNPFGVNAFVLSNEAKDAILIDASVSTERERTDFGMYIKSNGLKVRRVLNTHLHLDHVLGNAFVEREFGVKAEAHQEDNFLLDLQEKQSMMFGLPCPDPAPALGGFLAEGDTVEIPGIKLHVIHVAGHSPGGLAFYCENSNAILETDAGSNVKANGNPAEIRISTPILFPGDILFAGSVGRSDLFGGDEEALLAGIKSKLMTLPENTLVFPGHGPSTTIGDEKMWFE